MARYQLRIIIIIIIIALGRAVPNPKRLRPNTNSNIQQYTVRQTSRQFEYYVQ